MKRILFTSATLIVLLLSQSVYGQTLWQDSESLEGYIDGLVPTYMEENHIAGATVGIVKDGETVLLKGYGFSDVESEQAVNPGTTLFRIGSISKMFVWTAVMQLAEDGKVDLEADINNYLNDFKVPNTYNDAITLRHLMTHSAGFEDYVIGLFANSTDRLRPLGEILAEEMPKRVRPPGLESSYSNHGTGMAAYIVEQVSGLKFEDYVEQNILEPLGMSQSTFRQPLPANMSPDMSKGYAFEGGIYKEKDFEYVPLGPVGAASASASDMIRFMKAHLQYGELDDERILENTTARQMQEPAFRHTDSVNPMRHGFIDMSQNGVEIIGHGGDTFWFHSNMALFPEHDLGFFISFNSANGGSEKSEVLRDFVDHYFPEETAMEPLSVSDSYLQQFAGKYRSNRYPHERLTYVLALLSSTSVDVSGEGTLKTMEDEKAQFWAPVDSLTFQNTKDSRTLAFSRNYNGEIDRMYRGSLPIIAFEKIPLISSQMLHFTLFGIVVFAFGLTLVYWPSAYLIRRNYKPDYMAEYPISKANKAVAWVAGLLILGFLAGFAIVAGSGNGEAIVFGISNSIKALLILPLASAVLTLVMIYYTFRLWQRGRSGIWSRLWYTVLCLLSMAYLWQLWFWKLLGFNF